MNAYGDTRREGMRMKYIFCSSVYNMAEYEEIAKNSKIPASLADHNLNSNVICGLDLVTGTPVTLINNMPIPNYPCYPKILFKKKSWSHTEGAADINCGFINLPILKHISRAITTYFRLKQEIQAAGNTPVYVFTYDLHIEICLAIRWMKRAFPKVHTCAVLPDIPNAAIVASNGGRITAVGKFRASIKMWFIRQFDAFVVLTEYMRDIAGIREKPSVVMEGIYNDLQPPLPPQTTDKKVILYSGQLNPAYGMENLLEAFLEIYQRDSSYALWICGAGGMADRITALAAQCPGIRYFGYVGPEKVRALQAEATVLVNPRQNTQAFTKYSFPSKTMEYLASGRPVIGYRLDGIPDEYGGYICYVPDNSVEALRDKILEICSLPAEERQEIGSRAREFILREKNPKSMCQRIVQLWEQI